jgi:hypothetical protein
VRLPRWWSAALVVVLVAAVPVFVIAWFGILGR